MQAAAPEAHLLPFTLMFLLTRMSSACLDYVVSCDKESPCFKIATATDISMLEVSLRCFCSLYGKVWGTYFTKREVSSLFPQNSTT
jgi:hypothetical protein